MGLSTSNAVNDLILHASERADRLQSGETSSDGQSESEEVARNAALALQAEAVLADSIADAGGIASATTANSVPLATVSDIEGLTLREEHESGDVQVEMLWDSESDANRIDFYAKRAQRRAQ